MVKFEGSINSQGKLYLPVEMRNELGKHVELVGNAKTVVIYEKGLQPLDVLRSLEVVIADLNHRRELAEREQEEAT